MPLHALITSLDFTFLRGWLLGEKTEKLRLFGVFFQWLLSCSAVIHYIASESLGRSYLKEGIKKIGKKLENNNFEMHFSRKLSAFNSRAYIKFCIKSNYRILAQVNGGHSYFPKWVF